MNLMPKATEFSRYLRNFFHTESAGGIVMMLAAAVAIIWANTAWYDGYKAFTILPLTAGAGEAIATIPLKMLVKDVFMAFFFFVVGMELKREMREGFLAGKGQKILPLIGATGGMALPALIYVAFNYSDPERLQGWAIPAATDIAFAIAVLMLTVRNLPPAAKIYLLAVAIYDDLGAILIIALFYSSSLHLGYLLGAAAVCLLLWLMNHRGIGHAAPYILVLLVLVYLLHHGGIHSSIAGVLAGLAVPLRRFDGDTSSPLGHIMHVCHPWVAFGVLPLFALVAAGISFKGMSPGVLFEPVAFGTAMGLFAGKAIGIFGLTYLAVKLGIAGKPEGTTWKQLLGVAFLAGIGFTMSLFIGGLAFPDSIELQNEAKLGVIVGSLLSTLVGAIVMRSCKVAR